MTSIPPAVITLGTEAIHRTLWYPTILGVLVVVAAAVLFVGSIYLMLGTNMGARLAFLAVFSGLTGFMVVLTTLWMTTASPLNTIKGSIPKWEVKEVVDNPAKSKIDTIRQIESKGTTVPAIEAANVKAAVDEALITKVNTAIEKFTPADNKYALFDVVTQYQGVTTWEVGGSKPSFLDFQFTHAPKYAVVQFCGNSPNTQPFGVAPDVPKCAPVGTPEAAHNGYVVLEYNLGDLRQPPMVAFLSSAILFAISLALFNWFEKDRRAAQEAEKAGAPVNTARARESVGV
ncbi:MAG: hypothetical protein WCI50_00200 [Actinomycetes bacterium]